MNPITFKPLYMERVWGGREFERVYHRSLSDSVSPFGESWEIVDREGEQSVVDEGPLAGKTLHELWTFHREEIFGTGYGDHPRFPILIKVLDARDDLSIQVHPPAYLAAELGGEPKTEMWYIAACEPGSKLYVGLKQASPRPISRKPSRTAASSNACMPSHHSPAIPSSSVPVAFTPSARAS